MDWKVGFLDVWTGKGPSVGTGKRNFSVCRLGMMAALTEKLGRMNVPAYMPVTALLGFSVSPASGEISSDLYRHQNGLSKSFCIELPIVAVDLR